MGINSLTMSPPYFPNPNPLILTVLSPKELKIIVCTLEKHTLKNLKTKS